MMATYAISDLHGRMDLFRQVKESFFNRKMLYMSWATAAIAVPQVGNS